MTRVSAVAESTWEDFQGLDLIRTKGPTLAVTTLAKWVEAQILGKEEATASLGGTSGVVLDTEVKESTKIMEVASKALDKLEAQVLGKAVAMDQGMEIRATGKVEAKEAK